MSLESRLPERRATIKKTFLRLSQLTDPDLYPGDADAKELATEAHALLQAFYEQALSKVQSGEYGRAPQRGAEANSAASIATTRRHYRIEKALAQGDLATVFEGVCEEGEGEAAKIVIKLVEDPADNDLMQNRSAMPNADFTKWQSAESIADSIFDSFIHQR